MSDSGSTRQIDGEPNDAHAGRLRYLELGPGRTLLKLSVELGLSARTIERWSAAWGWVKLAAQYDQEMALARHELTLCATKAEAIAKSGLPESLDALALQAYAHRTIAARFDDLLDQLLVLATSATLSPQVQLGAIKHALALAGVSPVKRIDQRTELSGSLDVDTSAVDVAEADLEAILEAMPMETIRALDDAYQGSPLEGPAPEAGVTDPDGEAAPGLH